MSRLIDAEQIPYVVTYIDDSKWITKSKIDAMPTIDAAPIIHAHWISFRDAICNGYRCSNCKQDLPAIQVENADDCDFDVYESIMPTNYCPNCGAKMDEKDEDNNDSIKKELELAELIGCRKTVSSDDGICDDVHFIKM